MNSLSIVIPYYKGKKYILHNLNCIQNSISKTNLKFEIIIINDSPDENIEYLEELYINTKVYNNISNSGIAKSRNIGKSHAKYKYIYFIDQDDWVNDDFFQEIENAMDKEYDAIFFNFYLNYFESNIKINYKNIFTIMLRYWLTPIKILKYGNFFTTVGQVVIKNEYYPNFFECLEQGSDDQFMFMELLLNKKNIKIGFIKKPIFNYRIHKNNYTKEADFKSSTYECFDKFCSKHKTYKQYKHYLDKYYSKSILYKIKIKFILFLYKY